MVFQLKIREFIFKNKIEILLFIITLIIVSSYGINDFPILKDNGYYSYISQEVARGYILYSTAVISKPPLFDIIHIFGMNFFYFLPQYLSIRVFMTILIAIMVLLFYNIVFKISRDKFVSVLSVLILISFTFFIELFMGGDPKLFVLLFSFLAILTTFRGSYLLSGIFVSLSAFSFQANILFLVVPLVFPVLEGNNRKIWFRKVCKALMGALIPFVSFGLYFFYHGYLAELMNWSVLYAFKYQTNSLTIWTVFNTLGYYCSEFFFLILGVIGLLYALYNIFLKAKKQHFSDFLFKNKYLIAFILPFILLSSIVFKDFDDGSDLTLFLPVISVLAAYSLRKAQLYMAKSISGRIKHEKGANKITAFCLILIVCIYGFFPIFQPVYPENPIIKAGKEFYKRGSQVEMFSTIDKEFGIFNAVRMFLFRRLGEQIDIQHQLKLAELIKNNTNKSEKILSFSAPEILFLTQRRNMNRYPLFDAEYKVAVETGEVDVMREDVIQYRPKFILASLSSKIEIFGLSEFIEKNYKILDLGNPLNEEYIVYLIES